MSYEKALAYLRDNFRDGEYIGDNPYLDGTSTEAIICRWRMAGNLTEAECDRLLQDCQQ